MLIRLQWLFFFLLGLAPFKYTRISQNFSYNRNNFQGIEFSSSKINIFYSLFLIIYIFIASYFCQSFSTTDCNCKNDTRLTNISEVILSLVGNIVCVVLLFLFMILRHSMVEIAYQLTDIDIVMNKFWHIFKLESVKIKVVVVLYINTLLSTIVIMSEIFLSIQFNTAMCLYLFHGIVFNYFVTQYTVALMLIEKRFKSCNNALLNSKKIITSLVKIINVRNHSLTKTCIVEIIGLKRYYTMLCQLSTKFENFYSFGMLCIIPYNIACIVLSTHNLMAPLMQSRNLETLVWRDINDLFWILSKIFPLLTATAYATEIQIEVSKSLSLSSSSLKSN